MRLHPMLMPPPGGPAAVLARSCAPGARPHHRQGRVQGGPASM